MNVFNDILMFLTVLLLNRKSIRTVNGVATVHKKFFFVACLTQNNFRISGLLKLGLNVDF